MLDKKTSFPERPSVSQTHIMDKHVPLEVTSAIPAFSGNSVKASVTAALWIESVPSAFLLLTLSAVALSSSGLLLILTKVLIRARDSAVELWTKISNFLGFRILENMASCKGVGAMNTTYSARQR